MIEAFQSYVGTADAQVAAAGVSGVLHGVIITASATGSIAIYDGTATTDPALTVIRVPSADSKAVMHMNIAFHNGLYADIGGGVTQYTMIYG